MSRYPLRSTLFFLCPLFSGLLACFIWAATLPPAAAQERGGGQTPSLGFAPRPEKSAPDKELRFLRDSTAAAAISADKLLEDRERKRVIGRGFADLRFLGKRVQADHIEVQTETRDAVATGNIIFQAGNDRIVGSRIDFNLDSERLVIYDAKGYLGATYYITGNVVRRISVDRYEVIDGTFTTCEGDKPDWAFHSRKSTFQIEGYAHLQAPLLSLRGVPAAALPYAIFPIKSKRETGFLIPTIGSGNRNGLEFSPRFFWAINKWSDATFGVDYYEKRGSRYLGEYRYILSKDTAGQFNTTHFKDKLEKTTLWDIKSSHISSLPGDWGFSAVTDFASRKNDDRSLERNLNDRVRQDTDTRLDFTHDLGSMPGRLRVAMRRREGLRENDGDLFQKFPHITLDVNQSQIGSTEFRYSLDSSTVSFYRVENEKTTVLQRFDAAPLVSLPLETVPWLGVTANFGLRYTYWTDQKRTPDVEGNPSRNDQKQSPLSREIWFSSLGVAGPRFSRVYNGEFGPFRDFKHILSFQTGYSYAPAIDSRDRKLIIPIDSVDSFSDHNSVSYGIVNRVLTKLKTGEGFETRQLFTASLTQSADIAEARREQNLSANPRRPFGDVVLDIQSRPISLIRFTHVAIYDPYEHEIDRLSTGLLLEGGRNWYLGLDRTWSRQRSRGRDPQSGRSDLNFSAGYGLTRRWFLEYLTRINNVQNITLQQSIILRYAGCCWGFNLTFTDTQDISEVFFTFTMRGLLEGEKAPTFKRRQRVSERGRFIGRGALTPYQFTKP